MLLKFTPYISVIVKNANLLTENKKRIERLEHLMELTKYVNSTLDLDSLLNTMLEISTDMLGAEAGSVLLLDEKKEELVFAAATGTERDKIKHVRVPVGDGIAGWVAREDESVLVADAQHDPRFFKKADENTSFKTKTIIAVPLKTKQKIVGVVEILNKKDDTPFNDEDKNLLEALANQAAVAIENAKLYSDTKDMFLNTIKALATAIDTKDKYTRGHSDGVTNYSILIGESLGFSPAEIEDLRIAALFHDIGKIGIDESILRKPSKLTTQEFEEIKKHPDYGANILESIPQLKEIIPIVRHHHERFDGNGYPAGLSGEQIPFNSRVISIADTFDAMLTDRPYRKGLPLETCMQELLRCAGTQFDPEIVPVAVKTLKKYFAEKKKKKTD
jgi:putative nucleotidyltransferase with HDIG domain